MGLPLPEWANGGGDQTANEMFNARAELDRVKRIVNVKSAIDQKGYVPPNSISNKRSKLQTEAEQKKDQYINNRILLQKMIAIDYSESPLSPQALMRGRHFARSINGSNRKFEMIRIAEENRYLYNRIQGSRPQVQLVSETRKEIERMEIVKKTMAKNRKPKNYPIPRKSKKQINRNKFTNGKSPIESALHRIDTELSQLEFLDSEYNLISGRHGIRQRDVSGRGSRVYSARSSNPDMPEVEISYDLGTGQPSFDIYSKSYERSPPNDQFLESVEARRESKQLEEEFLEQQRLFKAKNRITSVTSYAQEDEIFLKREFSASRDQVLETDRITGKLRKKSPAPKSKSSGKVVSPKKPTSSGTKSEKFSVTPKSPKSAKSSKPASASGTASKPVAQPRPQSREKTSGRPQSRENVGSSQSQKRKSNADLVAEEMSTDAIEKAIDSVSTMKSEEVSVQETTVAQKLVDEVVEVSAAQNGTVEVAVEEKIEVVKTEIKVVKETSQASGNETVQEQVETVEDVVNKTEQKIETNVLDNLSQQLVEETKVLDNLTEKLSTIDVPKSEKSNEKEVVLDSEDLATSVVNTSVEEALSKSISDESGKQFEVEQNPGRSYPSRSSISGSEYSSRSASNSFFDSNSARFEDELIMKEIEKDIELEKRNEMLSACRKRLSEQVEVEEHRRFLGSMGR